MTLHRFLVLGILACVATACSEIPKRDPAKAGPFFTPTNVTRAGRLPIELRRVVILPAHGGKEMTEDSLNKIDQAVLEELNRTGRFEVAQLSRANFHRAFGVDSVASIDALPPQLFDKVRQEFAADGILFVDVTAYSAYPPLVLGLRFKLAQVSDKQILWAADNIFSASNPSVANSARRHALALGSDRGPGDLSHTVLQNPRRFASYAAASTFDTLPLR